MGMHQGGMGGGQEGGGAGVEGQVCTGGRWMRWKAGESGTEG
jgi:hypothetical protein